MKSRNSEKLAFEWFEKGNHDFQDAQRLYKNGGYPDTICFHCHQAAEKYLKGFLVFNRKVPKKVHDLVVLLEGCHAINKKFRQILDEAKQLNKYYIEARYPSEIPILYSKEEVKQALERAEKIVSFVAGKLKSRK